MTQDQKNIELGNELALVFEGKPCIKCNYKRQSTDDSPEWACPSCGVAYVKAEAAEREKQAELDLQNRIERVEFVKANQKIDPKEVAKIKSDKSIANLIYILFFGSILGGISGLAAIALAHIHRKSVGKPVSYTHLLLSVNNITLITSTLMAIILCYWQRNVTDSHVLMSWLALIVIINVVRIGIGFYYKKNPSSDINIIQKRLTTFRVGVISGSIIWGATSLFLFPANDREQQMLLLYMLTGFSAGSFYSYSIDFISVIAYTLFSLIPILIRLLVTGENFPMLMGASGLSLIHI